MSKLFSTSYNTQMFNAATLLLRVAGGLLMSKHGYDKIQHFDTYVNQFISVMNLSPHTCLMLTIIAEFFFAILIFLGFLTRLSTIPLIITMCVALFIAHKGQAFGEGEMAAVYLIIYLALLLVGAGKWSLDAWIGKK